TSDQRSDVEAHLRWAERGFAAGLRLSARRLDTARTAQGAETALRRGFAYARAYLLAPVLPRLALRAVALGWRERARGLDAGARYQVSRSDLGARLGAVWTPGEEWIFEAGAARAASPGALGDPMFYLHEDTYQLTPRRLSQWEAGRLAQQGNAWVDLGSVEGGRYDAVERGVLNLELASRLSLHAELRNDLD